MQRLLVTYIQKTTKLVLIFFFIWRIKHRNKNLRVAKCGLLIPTCNLLDLCLLYSHNRTIQIYRCREIRNTGDSPLFRYETFINFLTLVFRQEERETQFLLCWLYYLTQKTRCASRSPQLDRPGPESDLN